MNTKDVNVEGMALIGIVNSLNKMANAITFMSENREFIQKWIDVLDKNLDIHRRQQRDRNAPLTIKIVTVQITGEEQNTDIWALNQILKDEGYDVFKPDYDPARQVLVFTLWKRIAVADDEEYHGTVT